MRTYSVSTRCFIWTVLLCAVVLISCQKRPIPKGPNVLLVTFDTVRADHVGCYGNPKGLTPTVDHLASQGIVFRQCTSPAPITLPTHASILTGLDPIHHKVRNNGSYRLMPEYQTLATILHGSGYDTAAFVSAQVLNSQYGLARGFDVYDDTVSESDSGLSSEIAERNATDTTDAVLKWLTHRSGDRPFFLWVHYFDPHMAYNPPPYWRERFPDDPYSGEIAYADSELGRIIEQIRLDSTFVVFTADHGESLGEHGELTHAFFAYDSTLHVPLVLVFPDGRFKGTERSEQVSLVDIAPTVLNHLDVPLPADMDGVDLLSEHTTEEPRYVYFETAYPLSFDWSPLVGFRSIEWKFIKAPRPELYYLSDDPGELSNVFADHPDVVAPLERKLIQMKALESFAEEDSKKTLNADEREMLASLGYVGDSGGSVVSDTLKLPDPKDMLGDYLKFLHAKQDFFSNNHDAAMRGFTQLIETQPNLLQPRFMLGRTLEQLGNYGEAIEVYEKAIGLHPLDPSLWYALASTCNKAGMSERAIAVCEDGLKTVPNEASLFDQMGLAHKLIGNLDKAVGFGEKAVKLRPDSPEYLNNLAASYLGAGKLPKAEKVLNKAVEINSEFSEAWHNLGVLYQKRKDYPAAEKSLRRAVQISESNLDAWIQLAKTLLYLENSDEALTVAQRILALQPQSAEAHYFMSVAFRQKSNAIEAERALKRYLQLVPDSAPAVEDLCRVLLQQRDEVKTREARSLAEQYQARGITLPSDLKKELGL